MGEHSANVRDRAVPAYALDDRWTGLRSFGGHGGSNGALERLTLAFHGGVPGDDVPRVRVETMLPQQVGMNGPRDPVLHRLLTAHSLLGKLVHDETLYLGINDIFAGSRNSLLTRWFISRSQKAGAEERLERERKASPPPPAATPGRRGR